MGSLENEWKRLRADLESQVEPPKDAAKEQRRQEAIAELDAMAERRQNMSEEEKAAHKAWRESPEAKREIEELEAELRRRGYHRLV